MSDSSETSSVKPTAESAETAKRAPGLLRSSGTVGMMTMLSRVLGLVRDMVIARYFGASSGADAFFVAFRIPNFMRRLFAEGAFSQAFVPVLSEYRQQRSHAEVKRLVDAVAGTLGFILLCITLLAMIGSPVLTTVFAPGFLHNPLKFGLASEMLRITFPYLLLISLTAFAGGILNSYDRFAVPAFTPVLLNICLISAAVLLAPHIDQPVVALAWGVLIAGMLQLFFQLPFLMRLGLMPRPRLDYFDPGVRQVLKLMTPALFGVSVSQINLLLDTVLASFLQTGSVSWLYYSDRLAELPLGVFGIAIATVILPNLSRKHAAKSQAEFAATIDWGMRAVLVIGVPAALALVVLAVPLLSTLFHYGQVSAHDVDMSSRSLRGFAVGLVAFMLIKVLAPGFYARKNTRTPVRIGIVAMVANMGFNLALVFPLAHAGLALATSLSAWLNAGLLLRGLHREKAYTFQSGWAQYGARLLLGNVVLVAILISLKGSDARWLTWDALQRGLHLAVLVVAGLAGYFLTLFLSGMRLRQFLHR